MKTKPEAWATLREVVLSFDPNEEDSRKALHVAALEYAEACGFSKAPVKPTPSASDDGFTFRFGSAKGKTVAETDTKSLKWYAKVLSENVVDPEKSRFARQNAADLARVEKELATR